MFLWYTHITVRKASDNKSKNSTALVVEEVSAGTKDHGSGKQSIYLGLRTGG